MLQLVTRPERAHQTAGGVRVGAEEQMPYLVRDRQSKHRRRIGPSRPREPLHAIDEYGRQPAFAGLRVDQGVAELKQPVCVRGGWQSCQPDRHFAARQRPFASVCGGARPADDPGSIDAGDGQDPSRRTQSSRLIRRRHHRHVVDTHRQLGSNLRSVFGSGVHDT